MRKQMQSWSVALAALAAAAAPFVLAGVVVVSRAALAAQETKPVPKDSARVTVPGCVKGRIFTAAERTAERTGSADIPEGTHLRMNGPKQLMSAITALDDGTMIEITGLMKKGQYKQGIAIGGGIRVSPGPSPTSGGAGLG